MAAPHKEGKAVKLSELSKLSKPIYDTHTVRTVTPFRGDSDSDTPWTPRNCQNVLTPGRQADLPGLADNRPRELTMSGWESSPNNLNFQRTHVMNLNIYRRTHALNVNIQRRVLYLNTDFSFHSHYWKLRHQGSPFRSMLLSEVAPCQRFWGNSNQDQDLNNEGRGQ